MNAPRDNIQVVVQQLINSGQHSEAERVLNERCSQPPVAAESWFLLGAVRGIRGKHQSAEECFRNALTLNPNFVQARFNLSLALRDQGRCNEAAAELRTLLTEQPNHVEASNALGCLYAQTEDRGEAEQCFRKALRAAPAHLGALMNLANILSYKKEWPEAMGLYRRVLELAPGNADAAINLGGALVVQERFNEALVVFNKVNSVTVANIEPYCQLGVQLGIAFKRLAQPDLADQALNAVLRVSPHHDEAKFLLASLGRSVWPERAPSEHVVRIFDNYAEIFDEHLGKLEYHIPDLLYQALENLLPRSMPIYTLDIGCGTGSCGGLFKPASHTLVGIDLSPKMIEKARSRGVYDELVVGDLVQELSMRVGLADLVLAADVFVYIGDLEQVFEATAKTLRVDGLFAFSVESTEIGEGDTYALRGSGRYAHSIDYIQALAARYNFSCLLCQKVCVRLEANQPITGAIYILKINKAAKDSAAV